MWSLQEAALLVGASPRNVQLWSETGVLTAARETTGTGSFRWYSLDNLVELAAVMGAGKIGIKAKRRLVATIRKRPDLGIVSVSLDSDDVALTVNLHLVRQRVMAACSELNELDGGTWDEMPKGARCVTGA
jgi:hypothetical protein